MLYRILDVFTEEVSLEGGGPRRWDPGEDIDTYYPACWPGIRDGYLVRANIVSLYSEAQAWRIIGTAVQAPGAYPYFGYQL